MRTYSFHEVLDHILLARSFTKTKFDVIGLPDVTLLFTFLRGKPRRLLRPVIVIYQHILFVLSLVRASRTHDLIIAREFLSVPLICVALLAAPARKKICFIVNHNLQKALTLKTQRFALTLLCRMNFKFVFLEGMDGLEKLGVPIRREQFFYLPNVVVPVAPGTAPTSRQKRRVGAIGEYRPEKGIAKLIPYLIALQQHADIDIMLGSSNSAELEKALDCIVNTIEIVDTSTPEAYAKALSSCDVVILNYSYDNYYYRSSGVIVNAIECGANIVCPDYPVFRKQVLNPIQIGALFTDESEIFDAITSVLAQRDALCRNIEAYAAARTPQAVARHIDEFAKINRLI
ncbi:glycosyltransferase [Methylocapsa acidiphila]|uniref:glycosyltransferase n=1 Tax=Methylocapsa acidiphila TaxID=133552 RepID=UPI0004223C6D|nr:glycosyltransferase [Methylocapsa acidiphila]